LGPWTEASSGDSRGTLRDLNLRDLVPLQCVSGTSTVLKIEAADGRAGEIHFADGHICHATASGFSGTEALHEIMRWKNARATETERAADAPRTIHGPWQHVFLEALRIAKPSAEKVKISLLPRPSREEQKPVRTGKKIVVIDDTEMLLIFVEDSLSIGDSSLQVVTALTGSEGVRRAEQIIPDLVLLDYSLPDLRGDQICERLLQNTATARIPVVMMSGHVPEMLATAERYPNVVATIAKPFMSEALVRLVNETLARGFLPGAAQEETASAWTITDHPVSVAAPELKAARHGNGKKPVKRSASAKTPTKALREEAISSPPAPIMAPAPPPPAPPPPSQIEITEVIAIPAVPVPAPSPALRDIRPAEPAILAPPPLSSARPARLPGPNGGAVVLGLGMEVISVQFTPRFQIGTIRAKPSATTLSLTQLLMPADAENRWGSGFELGAVELGSDGRIKSMRVRPTRKPAESIRTHNGFDINDVNLVNETACIQFTAGPSAPMTMQLVAVFKVAGVELSDQFEVAQLVLQPESSRVRITLEPQAGGAAGTEFETVGVRLDPSGRIAEFVLRSLQADQTERRVHVA
jgi:CheY-like chemotaxis protein